MNPDEMDLRRRARRRLVGAVALALVAVVVLPMVFDPEPKPLGSDVDIRIPDPASPFPAAGQVPPGPPAPVPEEAAGEPPALTPTPQPEVRPEAAAPPAEKPKPADAGQTGAKPAEPEKPAKPPAGPFATEGYFLQLGAFSAEKNARQLADKAAAAGFRTSVYSANGQSRVRVGPYTDRGDALEMQRKLKAKGFGTVLLGP